MTAGKYGGFSGKLARLWSLTVYVPTVPGSRNQYGCEYGVLVGMVGVRSLEKNWSRARSASTACGEGSFGKEMLFIFTGTCDRLMACSFSGKVWPGVTVKTSVKASTYRPRQDAIA